MAGFICISLGPKKLGFSAGSHKLAPIAERTKEELEQIAPQFVEDMYQPYSYQQMIALDEQSAEGFMAFYKATLAAYHKFCLDPSEQEFDAKYGVSKEWRELIGLLEQDPRFSGKSFFEDVKPEQ